MATQDKAPEPKPEPKPEPVLSLAEQIKAAEKLWNKQFSRFDPTTGAAHETNKEFFWGIVGQYPASKAGANMNAPVLHFEVQRYWRNKTYEAKLPPGTNGPKDTVIKNLPWVGETPDGETIPGMMQISMPDFLKQFEEE